MSLPPTMTPTILDTHGAGAMRNDPKVKDTGTTYPYYHGPQGDIIYVNNFVRCVRNISNTATGDVNKMKINIYPNPFTNTLTITCCNNIESIKIFDITGNTCKIFEAGSSLLNVSDLISGIYFISVKTNAGTLTSKIIK